MTVLKVEGVNVCAAVCGEKQAAGTHVIVAGTKVEVLPLGVVRSDNTLVESAAPPEGLVLLTLGDLVAAGRHGRRELGMMNIDELSGESLGPKTVRGRQR